MSQADPSPLPPRQPPGIPCPQCGGVVWRVTCTRRVPGGIRRYRTCEGCSRRVTTLEARLPHLRVVALAGQRTTGGTTCDSGREPVAALPPPG